MRALIAAAMVSLVASTASTADAESRIRPAASFDVSYGRAWVHGVDVTLLDARLAGGFSTNAKEGTYIDVLAAMSLIRGWTEGGRDIQGMGLFGPMLIVHTAPLRFGGGFEVGYLTVDRSTASDDQAGVMGRFTGLLGIEPFKIGNVAATVDVRGHLGAWGDSSLPGVSLALGVRY